MDSQTRRVFGVSCAFASILAGLGFYYDVTPLKAFALPLLVGGLVLTVVAYSPDIANCLSGTQDTTRLSRGLRLISYETKAYHRPETPYATAIKIRLTRSLQPARFHVVCDVKVFDATATLDISRDGEWVDGYSYYDSARIQSSKSIVIEISDRPITPEDELVIEVRSVEPIQIVEVRKVRAKGAHGIGVSGRLHSQ